MRRDYADSKQKAGGDQHNDHSQSQHIRPQRTDQLSHDFAVVDQHVEKEQSRRHGQHGDHIHDQHDINQRDAGNQHQSSRRGGLENQDKIKRFSLLEGKIQTVRAVSDFPEGVGRRS